MSKTPGVIVIVLGPFGLAWGGSTYTTREKVVDIGPIHATREETHSVLSVLERWVAWSAQIAAAIARR